MSKTLQPYTAFENGSDGKPFVDGPGSGCSYYSGTLFPEMRLTTHADAEAAARIANEAYRQGRDSMRRDIMGLLSGDTP